MEGTFVSDIEYSSNVKTLSQILLWINHKATE